MVQPCAGGIVLLDGRLLLIKRGRPPAQGCWSVPGGRCHRGESPEQACVRELAEETGLRVEVVRLAGRVERDAPDGSVYVIDDFVCTIAGGAGADGAGVHGAGANGSVRAGDDADDARWFSRADLATVELSPGLYACLDEWGVLPD